MKTLSITPRRTSAIASMLGLSALVAVTVVGTNLASATSALGPTNTQRHALALRDVRHLLAIAPLPPGARRFATYDVKYRSVLGQAQGLAGGPDTADAAEFFEAAHGAAATSWLNRVRVGGAVHTGSGSSAGPGSFNATFVSFSFPATSILQQPQLEYTMIATARGALEVRVDAEVQWTPRKSKYSQIPGDATKVVVTVDNHALNGDRGVTTTTDSSNPADLKLLVTAINSLPAMNPGLMFCPFDNGSTVTLAFFVADSSTPYARVVAVPGGCGSVSISQYAADGTLLGATKVGGGTTLARFVAQTLHVKAASGLD